MREIVRINDMAHRMPQHGRIRTGVKTSKAMKAIDTFRFTSPDEKAIRQIAQTYGGKVQAWYDKKADPPDQFEVITEADEIEVFLPPDCLSASYELWGGGGIIRRCDGAQCEVVEEGPGGPEPVYVPCICTEKGRRDCKQQLRLTVVLPSVRFRGGWRLDTKSWSAMHEMPGMVAMIQNLQNSGHMTRATLSLESHEKVIRGKKKKFKVPVVGLDESPQAVLEGGAMVQAIAKAGLPELEAGPEYEEVVDAEIVEDEMATPEEVIRQAEKMAGGMSDDDKRKVEANLKIEELGEYIRVKPEQRDQLAAAVARTISKGEAHTIEDLTADQQTRLIERVKQILAGELVYRGLDDNGYIKVAKS